MKSLLWVVDVHLHWKSFKYDVKVTCIVQDRGIVQDTADDIGFAWASVGELVLLLEKKNLLLS